MPQSYDPYLGVVKRKILSDHECSTIIIITWLTTSICLQVCGTNSYNWYYPVLSMLIWYEVSFITKKHIQDIRPFTSWKFFTNVSWKGTIKKEAIFHITSEPTSNFQGQTCCSFSGKICVVIWPVLSFCSRKIDENCLEKSKVNICTHFGLISF